jgi:cytosine/adenosine deaminase-related metal-dependent hydrolase
MACRKVLHARYVLPVVGEPIENGFVSIEAGRIAEVGRSSPRGEWLDLGNAAILPGLVNAHTHLEFSGLAQPLGSPGMRFVNWIRAVIAWREGRRDDSAMTIRMGLHECRREGVTCVGNISQQQEPQSAYEGAGIDGTRFIEIISPSRDVISSIVDLRPKHCPADPIPLTNRNRNSVTELVGSLSNRSPARDKAEMACWESGLSPHAPYTVHPDLWETFVGISTALKLPLAVHLAESYEEMQLLREGAGPLRDLLESRGSFDERAFPGGKRPLDYLRLLARALRALVVHGNYLDDEEIAFLAGNAEKMALVYCPRTHAFFRHDRYPLEKMLAAGVTVALGTDSRASSPDLSLLAEMRFVAKQFPEIDRERVLALGTLDGARALGRANEIGSLEPGKIANLTVVALPDDAVGDPRHLLLESGGHVTQTWFRGQCVSSV